VKVVVIGAGLIGLASAYCLQRQGAQVTVLEREAGPGRGTSFANGALLHPSLVDPWNAPGVLGFLLRNLGRDDSPMLLRARALPSLMSWGLRFVHESSPRRFARNTQRNLVLARYSLAQMAALREDTGLQYHQYFRGSLSIYRDDAAAAAARTAAEGHGIACEWLDRDGLVAAEPMLADVAAQLVGGLNFSEDESGDAHAFCTALADVLRQRCVGIELGCAVTGFQTVGASVRAVIAADRTFDADAVVLCAGVWSNALARRLQLSLPVQPAKGYSITLPVGAGPAPRLPVVDHGLHAAVVPVGSDRLRVAGTAEFTGMDLSISPARVANLEFLLRRIYPALAAGTGAADIRAWAGLRPMCADGVPLIGRTHWDNLFVNTGHGHLGWTLAAGSGQLIADTVAGRAGSIDARDYAPDRF
jgi:D-amino-acid dehydrogenase